MKRHTGEGGGFSMRQPNPRKAARAFRSRAKCGGAEWLHLSSLALAPPPGQLPASHWKKEFHMIPPRDINRPASIAEEGWCAFYAGCSARHCPYSSAEGRSAWLSGYHAAQEWFANE